MCAHNGQGYDCSTCYMDATEGPPNTPPLSTEEREQRTKEYNRTHEQPK
jgi:hypothetical protein